uniref:SAM domain-containing protein n=1 Tax=Timema genevievae TaxID=629358 RepID=A0A7R9PSH1_TIMGE|nr:unnamed protein product [Timema genevievae]
MKGRIRQVVNNILLEILRVMGSYALRLRQCVQNQGGLLHKMNIFKEGMVICSGCDEGFHFSCHSPRLSERVKNSKWFCHKCSLLQAKSSPVHVQVKGVAPPRESSIPDSIVKKYLAPPDPVGATDSDEPIDERIPDASGWSVDQVEEYLIEQGLPDQAAVFKEHDIDGPSLLLMKRNDVLCSLSLKLGPALKIYKHVKMLQIRRTRLSVHKLSLSLMADKTC